MVRELRRLDSLASPQARQLAAQATTLAAEQAQKIQALLTYLDLSRDEWLRYCMSKAGKMEEWSGWVKGKPKVHKQFKAARDDRAGEDEESARRRKRAEAKRASKARERWEEEVNAKRRQYRQEEPRELNERMHKVYEAYCDRPYLLSTGEHRMSVTGFLRLLHDCLLLDNATTPAMADAIFTGVPLGEPEAPKDIRLDFDGFKARLRELARQRAVLEAAINTPVHKRPPVVCESGNPPTGAAAAKMLRTLSSRRSSMGGTLNKTGGVDGPDQKSPADIAYLSAIRTWVLPLAVAQGCEAPSHLDGLYSRPCLDVLRWLEVTLRRLYGWYATLDDPRELPWDRIVEYGVTITGDSTVLLMLNFEVIPAFMARGEATGVYQQYTSPAPGGAGVGLRGASDGGMGERPPGLHFSGFLETLSLLAAHVADTLVPRMQSNATPEELRAYKRYMRGCEPALRKRMEQALAVVEALRRARLDDAGLQASGLGFFAFQGKRQEEQSATNAAAADLEARLGVLARREEARTKHALTRLRNYYTDVRSATELVSSSWPATGFQTGGSGALGGAWRDGGGAGADGGGAGEGAGNGDVAFFAGAMQIKTPKLPPTRMRVPALALPVAGGGVGGGGQGSPHSPPGAAQPPWRFANGQLTFEGGGGGGGVSRGHRVSYNPTLPNTALSSMTLQQQLALLGAGLSGGAGHSAGLPASSGYGYGYPGWKGPHLIDRVQIEARDEADVLREFTRTLPAVGSSPDLLKRTAGGASTTHHSAPPGAYSHHLTGGTSGLQAAGGRGRSTKAGGGGGLPGVLSSAQVSPGVLLTFHPHHEKSGVLLGDPSGVHGYDAAAAWDDAEDHADDAYVGSDAHAAHAHTHAHGHGHMEQGAAMPPAPHETQTTGTGAAPAVGEDAWPAGLSTPSAAAGPLLAEEPSSAPSPTSGPAAPTASPGSGLVAHLTTRNNAAAPTHSHAHLPAVAKKPRGQDLSDAAAVLGLGLHHTRTGLPPQASVAVLPTLSGARAQAPRSRPCASTVPGGGVGVGSPQGYPSLPLVHSLGMLGVGMGAPDPVAAELHALDEFEVRAAGVVAVGAGGPSVLVNQPWRAAPRSVRTSM